MKIIFVTMAPELAGGYRTVAFYADRLRRCGHEVNIVARLLPPPSAHAIFRSLLRGTGWPRRPKPDTTYLDQVQITPRYVDPPGPVTEANVPDDDMARAIEWIITLSESDWSRLSDLAFSTASRHNWDDSTDLFETALQAAIH